MPRVRMRPESTKKPTTRRLSCPIRRPDACQTRLGAIPGRPSARKPNESAQDAS